MINGSERGAGLHLDTRLSIDIVAVSALSVHYHSETILTQGYGTVDKPLLALS